MCLGAYCQRISSVKQHIDGEFWEAAVSLTLMLASDLPPSSLHIPRHCSWCCVILQPREQRVVELACHSRPRCSRGRSQSTVRRPHYHNTRPLQGLGGPASSSQASSPHRRHQCRSYNVPSCFFSSRTPYISLSHCLMPGFCTRTPHGSRGTYFAPSAVPPSPSPPNVYSLPSTQAKDRPPPPRRP